MKTFVCLNWPHLARTSTFLCVGVTPPAAAHRMDWTHVAPRGVAVKEVAGGLGLVALRDISEGELFFREAPFAVLRAASLQEACTTDPEMMELIAQVRVARAGVRGGVDPSARVIDRHAELEIAKLPERERLLWMSLADAFSEPPAKSAGNIYRTNAFTNSETMNSGLFEVLCRANHSCAPNTAREYDGDTAVLYALKDTKMGDELCISYLSEESMDKGDDARKEELRVKYNFSCTCERCAGGVLL